MYADPAHIRIKRVNLSLSAAEHRLVEAVSEFRGMQPSAFLRELVMGELEKQMHGTDSGAPAIEKRVAG